MFFVISKTQRIVRFLSSEPSYPVINGVRKPLFISQAVVHWAISFWLFISA